MSLDKLLKLSTIFTRLSIRALSVNHKHHFNRSPCLGVPPNRITFFKHHISNVASPAPKWFSTESNDSDHSKNDQTKNEEEIRKELLDTALKFVPSHGWTTEALAMAAEENGYPSITSGLFKKGGADLVLHLIKSNNDELVKHMDNIKSVEDGKVKVSQFIRDVLEHRLRMITPYIDVWPEAMAILLSPAIIGEATQELGRMVDDIWFHAGDQSTDFNWYTKRGLLAKLFVSTQTVMIMDKSPDFVDTWSFLDRRLKDIATFGKISHFVKEQGRTVGNAGVAGAVVLANILGVGERRR